MKQANVLKSRRSRRSITQACRLAGIPYDPEQPGFDAAAFGEILLQLLVAGVAHRMTGTEDWHGLMLHGAPADPIVTL